LLRLRLHVHQVLNKTLAVRAGMLSAVQSRSRVVLGVRQADRRVQAAVRCHRQGLLRPLHLSQDRRRAMTEPGPPAIARVISAMLLSPHVLDRLAQLVALGVTAEAQRNGGPSRDSLTLQRLLNEARADARRRMAHDDTDSDPAVTSCETMTTAQAADVLGVSVRTVQRHGAEFGRRVGRVWLFDPALVRAAADD
jgi:hypothetical protein